LRRRLLRRITGMLSRPPGPTIAGYCDWLRD
jgi:hypothetical protein